MPCATRRRRLTVVAHPIRRDEIVLPERRWPGLSTRAPVPPTPPPVTSNPPQYGMTLSAELRKAHTEEKALQQRQRDDRQKRDELERQAKMVAATREVATALGRADPREVRRREEVRIPHPHPTSSAKRL